MRAVALDSRRTWQDAALVISVAAGIPHAALALVRPRFR
jgi:hypothetical protein